MSESLLKVNKAVEEMDIDGITGLVEQCLQEGLSPVIIIQEGIAPGLAKVGELFETGEYFLADLVMAGEVVNEVMPLIKAKMDPTEVGKKGKVILATVKGDIHEIGKNIVGMLLGANGFEVIDLGVDVSAEKIVMTAKETGAKLIGLSVLLSTMVGNISKVVQGLKNAGLNTKVAIGGACTSEHLKKEMGADAYGENAVQAVRIFEELSHAS
jgi:methylmalonyl-CoA mutase cobalamin-binding domain/chain